MLEKLKKKKGIGEMSNWEEGQGKKRLYENARTVKRANQKRLAAEDMENEKGPAENGSYRKMQNVGLIVWLLMIPVEGTPLMHGGIKRWFSDSNMGNLHGASPR